MKNIVTIKGDLIFMILVVGLVIFCGFSIYKTLTFDEFGDVRYSLTVKGKTTNESGSKSYYDVYLNNNPKPFVMKYGSSDSKRDNIETMFKSGKEYNLISTKLDFYEKYGNDNNGEVVLSEGEISKLIWYDIYSFMTILSFVIFVIFIIIILIIND